MYQLIYNHRLYSCYFHILILCDYSKQAEYFAEVESRTQGSRPRPRTQKNPRPRPMTAFPRTDTLEAKDRNARGQGQGPRHKSKCSPEKKKGLHKNFSGDLKKKKKVFSKIFQAISTKNRFPKNFSSAPQNFNIPKNSAVLEPRTGQFSRTRGQGQGLDLRGQGLQNLSSRTCSRLRKSSRTPPLVFWLWTITCLLCLCLAITK